MQTGTNTWLPAGSPPGAVFGSSQNAGYLNLRPAADNAAGASVTTYTFAAPTPATGWGFVLGDIDADQVTVTATAPDGSQVAASSLGFAGVFNYCDRDSALGRLLGAELGLRRSDLGPGHRDPDREPGRNRHCRRGGLVAAHGPVETLTFTYGWRSGLPVYQTWFATQTRAVSGTVTGDGVGLPGVSVEIVDGTGAVVGSATTAAHGRTRSTGYRAGTYTVRVVTPDGYSPGRADRAARGPDRRRRVRCGLRVHRARRPVDDQDGGHRPGHCRSDPALHADGQQRRPGGGQRGQRHRHDPGRIDRRQRPGQRRRGVHPDRFHTLTCAVGSLANGDSVTVTVTGQVPANATPGAQLINTATITGDQVDSAPGNNKATVASTIAASADLAMVKTFTPAVPLAGQPVTHPTHRHQRRSLQREGGWSSPTRWTRQ